MKVHVRRGIQWDKMVYRGKNTTYCFWNQRKCYAKTPALDRLQFVVVLCQVGSSGWKLEAHCSHSDGQYEFTPFVHFHVQCIGTRLSPQLYPSTKHNSQYTQCTSDLDLGIPVILVIRRNLHANRTTYFPRLFDAKYCECMLLQTLQNNGRSN